MAAEAREARRAHPHACASAAACPTSGTSLLTQSGAHPPGPGAPTGRWLHPRGHRRRPRAADPQRPPLVSERQGITAQWRAGREDAGGAEGAVKKEIRSNSKDAEDGPLTLVAAPTMLSAVRFVEELPQDPRTAAVLQPRG